MIAPPDSMSYAACASMKCRADHDHDGAGPVQCSVFVERIFLRTPGEIASTNDFVGSFVVIETDQTLPEEVVSTKEALNENLTTSSPPVRTTQTTVCVEIDGQLS